MLAHLMSSHRLRKSQLSDFLGLPEKCKETKEILITQILALIASDPLEEERFWETFKTELAVEPTELEEILSCTPTERKRWIKEGKIPILEYRHFRKAGRNLQYPVHDRILILKIAQTEIELWRSQHQAHLKNQRQAGAKIAAETRKYNQQSRQAFSLAWEQIKQEWRENSSQEISLILQLAYWTVWVSRWAKENELKSRNAIAYFDFYQERKNELYAAKNQAIKILAQTPYKKLSFYRPEHPDKDYLHLCEDHYEIMQQIECKNKWEYFYYSETEIKRCPKCIYHVQKNYYSLYYLEIQTNEFPEFKFSFHTPYPIGKVFLPKLEDLPEIAQVEEDGLFRFGRPLLEQEKIIHREKDVLKNFQQALEAAQTIMVNNQRDRQD